MLTVPVKQQFTITAAILRNKTYDQLFGSKDDYAFYSLSATSAVCKFGLKELEI